MMLNPVINWFGRQVPDPAYETFDAASFRRFLIQTLGYDFKPTGDLLRMMTVIAGIDATDEEKDDMVARMRENQPSIIPSELDWRDYK